MTPTLKDYELQLRCGAISQTDFIQGVRLFAAALEAEQPVLAQGSRAHSASMNTLNTTGRLLTKGGEQ